MIVSWLPMTFDARIRLIAARIHPLKQKLRLREISIEAGRAGEALRMAGRPRWEAVRLEDEIAAALRARLSELDQLDADEIAMVRFLAAGGAA